MIDLLQKLREPAEALAPECAVEPEPIGKRNEPLWLWAVEDVPPLAPFLHKPCFAKRAQMLRHRWLRDGCCGCKRTRRDFTMHRDLLEHGTPRGIGKHPHDGGDIRLVHHI